MTTLRAIGPTAQINFEKGDQALVYQDTSTGDVEVACINHRIRLEVEGLLEIHGMSFTRDDTQTEPRLKLGTVSHIGIQKLLGGVREIPLHPLFVEFYSSSYDAEKAVRRGVHVGLHWDDKYNVLALCGDEIIAARVKFCLEPHGYKVDVIDKSRKTWLLRIELSPSRIGALLQSA